MSLPEPSAWLCVAADGTRTATTSEAERNALALCGRDIVPLYTHEQLASKDRHAALAAFVERFDGVWPGIRPNSQAWFKGYRFTRDEFDAAAHQPQTVSA